MIRPALPSDAEAIANIYNHYVRETIITFDLEESTPEDFEARIKNRSERHPFLVYESEGRVTAYAYANPYSPRNGYDPTVELSIYADVNFSGQGHALRIYKQLIEQLRELGFHSIIAGIALPNRASVRLHEHFGFEKVAHYSEVGYKFDQWIDVGYWQLKL